MPALDQLDQVFQTAWADPSFHAELDHLQRTYAGRPTALTDARRLAAQPAEPGCCSSARI